MTSTPFPAATGLAERITCFTVAIGRVIGQHAHKRPAAVPLLTLFCWWLQRMRERFERLAAHAAAGTLPARPAPPRTTPHQPPAQIPGQPPAQPRQRLPGSRAWVLQLIQPVGMYCAELGELMAHPDMVALLELAPQARRLLRPLCRMLTPDAVPSLGLPRFHNRPRPLPKAATPAPAAPPKPAAPPAPTPYGQGPPDFDPDQYDRHPFLPGHLRRRSGY